MTERKKVNCKACGRERPVFALGPNDCDKCRVENRRKVDKTKYEANTVVTKADIKAKGRKLLLDSDYRINKYSIEEPDPVKLVLWRDWRKAVRKKIKTCKDGDTMVFPKAPNQED